MSAPKPAVRQIIVVEGRYDRAAVLEAVDATVVETGGFGVFHRGNRVAYLRSLAEKRGIILLTDSDGAGFVIRGKLRGMLGEHVEILQAYIPQIPGKEKRKRTPSKAGTLGVEGMEREVILEALRRAGADFGTGGRFRGGITKADLYAMGLSGGADSGEKRKALEGKLGLPEGMSPTALLDALNAMMTAEELKTLLSEKEA